MLDQEKAEVEVRLIFFTAIFIFHFPFVFIFSLYVILCLITSCVCSHDQVGIFASSFAERKLKTVFGLIIYSRRLFLNGNRILNSFNVSQLRHILL